jgi:hemoglobin-like flavoprotein
MTTEDLVYRSFEIAAERLGDIVEPVYARYFARDPNAAALMAHVDQYTRGRMLDEVLRLLMATEYTDDQGYLNFEVKNHDLAYRVHAEMYAELLEAVRDTLRETLGADWDERYAAAWGERLGALLGEIEARLG